MWTEELQRLFNQDQPPPQVSKGWRPWEEEQLEGRIERPQKKVRQKLDIERHVIRKRSD